VASASSDQAYDSVQSATHSITHALYSLSDASATAIASDTTAAAADTAVHTAQRYTGWFSTLSDYLEAVLGYLQVRETVTWLWFQLYCSALLHHYAATLATCYALNHVCCVMCDL